jgi:hypothetical protein
MEPASAAQFSTLATVCDGKPILLPGLDDQTFGSSTAIKFDASLPLFSSLTAELVLLRLRNKPRRNEPNFGYQQASAYL